MAFSEKLAARVRAALSGVGAITEKRMFGGLVFMRDGAMLIGVDKDDLIVRCPKEETDAHLKRRGVRVFDLSGGRPMKGWLLVGKSATQTDRGFEEWIAFALAGAAAIGTKSASKKARTSATSTRGATHG